MEERVVDKVVGNRYKRKDVKSDERYDGMYEI